MADKPQEAIEDEGLTFLQKEAKKKATEDFLFQQHMEKYPDGKPAADTLRATPDPHAPVLKAGLERASMTPPGAPSITKLAAEELFAVGAVGPLLGAAARHPRVAEFLADERASGARSLGWEPEAVTWLARGLTHYGGQLAEYGGEVAERARKAVMGTPGKGVPPPVELKKRPVHLGDERIEEVAPPQTPPSEELKLSLESGQPAPLPKEVDEGMSVSGLSKTRGWSQRTVPRDTDIYPGKYGGTLREGEEAITLSSLGGLEISTF